MPGLYVGKDVIENEIEQFEPVKKSEGFTDIIEIPFVNHDQHVLPDEEFEPLFDACFNNTLKQLPWRYKLFGEYEGYSI